MHAAREREMKELVDVDGRPGRNLLALSYLAECSPYRSMAYFVPASFWFRRFRDACRDTRQLFLFRHARVPLSSRPIFLFLCSLFFAEIIWMPHYLNAFASKRFLPRLARRSGDATSDRHGITIRPLLRDHAIFRLSGGDKRYPYTELRNRRYVRLREYRRGGRFSRSVVNISGFRAATREIEAG